MYEETVLPVPLGTIETFVNRIAESINSQEDSALSSETHRELRCATHPLSHLQLQSILCVRKCDVFDCALATFMYG
jgi:hypothetical protein